MYSQIVYRREKWIEPHLEIFMEFVRSKIRKIDNTEEPADIQQ